MKGKTFELEEAYNDTALDPCVRQVAMDLDQYMMARHGRPFIITSVVRETGMHAEGRAVDGRIHYRTSAGLVLHHIEESVARACADYINSRWELPEVFSDGSPMLPCVVHADADGDDLLHFHLQVGRSRTMFRISGGERVEYGTLF